MYLVRFGIEPMKLFSCLDVPGVVSFVIGLIFYSNNLCPQYFF